MLLLAMKAFMVQLSIYGTMQGLLSLILLHVCIIM